MNNHTHLINWHPTERRQITACGLDLEIDKAGRALTAHYTGDHPIRVTHGPANCPDCWAAEDALRQRELNRHIYRKGA